MNDRLKGMTGYFRSAVAAQANIGIDFKDDYFSIHSLFEIMQEKINPSACEEIFAEAAKNSSHDENKIPQRNTVNTALSKTCNSHQENRLYLPHQAPHTNRLMLSA